MAKYCENCGAEIAQGTQFCPACGKKVEQQPAAEVKLQPQQQYVQQPPYAPITVPRGLSRMMIIGIIAIVIAVVIVSVVVVVVFSGGAITKSGADSRFVGEWEQDLGLGTEFIWEFNSDSTLATGSSGGAMYNVGTWKVNGDQLCLYNNAVCYTYEFSNNGDTLTLNIFGDSSSYPMSLVLTKKI